MFIEILIVLTGAEASIFLLDKEERGSLWRLGLLDFARFKMFVNELFTHFQFLGVHQVTFSHFRDKGLF